MIAGDFLEHNLTIYNISNKNGNYLYGDQLTLANNVGRTYVYASYNNIYGVYNSGFYSYKKFTTGTTYQTRASTSATRYLTCESTSAWSGVSSSSSSTMSWV